ncbi:hypothetical protein XENTR_v10007186 [Xenopus tropicalis]|nr:hypothetical protein XENTR_v10007186 [Xenopus tropicalis]
MKEKYFSVLRLHHSGPAALKYVSALVVLCNYWPGSKTSGITATLVAMVTYLFGLKRKNAAVLYCSTLLKPLRH